MSIHENPRMYPCRIRLETMSIQHRVREGGCPYKNNLGLVSIHNKPIEWVYVWRQHGDSTEGVKGRGNVHTRVKYPYKEESVCTNGCVHTG